MHLAGKRSSPYYVHVDDQPIFKVYGGYIGPFATLSSEPRQVRKEAAAVVGAGAGVWLMELPPITKIKS